MRAVGWVLALVLCAGGCYLPSQKYPEPGEIQSVRAAVVEIEGTYIVRDPIMQLFDGDGPDFQATGSFILPGRVLTAGHVCDDDNVSYEATDANGKRFKLTKWKSHFELGTNDVCVLNAVDYTSAVYLPLANSDPELGDFAWYVGFPNGMLYESEGRIGGLTDGALVTSVPGYPGASGSALLNDRGEVIGVFSAYHVDFSSMTFFTPVSKVWALLNA